MSRITVRQAVQELEKENLVLKSRGKGTLVIYRKKIEEHLNRILGFTDEMKERNMEAGTKLANIEIINSNEELSKTFDTDLISKFYKLTRVRTADSKPIVLFISYFPIALNLPLENEKYMDSLYHLFEELKIPAVVKVKEQFEAISSDDDISEYLGIKKKSPILLRIRKGYDIRNNLIEYTYSYYRGDSYSYHIELKK